MSAFKPGWADFHRAPTTIVTEGQWEVKPRAGIKTFSMGNEEARAKRAKRGAAKRMVTNNLNRALGPVDTEDDEPQE